MNEWQAHNGQVDNDGQGTDTPSVQYFYDDGTTGGAAKYIQNKRDILLRFRLPSERPTIG